MSPLSSGYILNADVQTFTPSSFTKLATITEHRKGPVLTSEVGNVTVEFLEDTGAESTVLGKRCFETLLHSIKAKFQDITSSVYVADGTKVWSKGPDLCNIVVRDHSICDIAFVAEIEDYALLGWDALQALGVEFKVAGVNLAEQAKVRWVTKPIIRRIKVTEDHVLPPRSEVLLPGSIDIDQLKRATLVRTTENIQQTGIVAARTITKVYEPECQLRVMNPSDKPQHLKADTVIAEAEVVDVLSTPPREASVIPPPIELPVYHVDMYQRDVTELNCLQKSLNS